MTAFLFIWNVIITVIAVRALNEIRYIHENIAAIDTILWKEKK